MIQWEGHPRGTKGSTAKPPTQIFDQIDDIYHWVKGVVAEETDMSKISKATSYTVLVSLPNGTLWSSGCVKTVDQKNVCPHP